MKNMSNISIDNIIAYDPWLKPVLHFTLQPDLPVLESEKQCFEQSKKALLNDPYFCSWSEKQIAEYLLLHFDKLADHFQFRYRSARITFSREIWGSCSWDNNILINFNICFQPFHLREYLFLHELVHTRVKDHSDDFWWMLNFCTNGKARVMDKELQGYEMRLTL